MEHIAIPRAGYNRRVRRLVLEAGGDDFLEGARQRAEETIARAEAKSAEYEADRKAGRLADDLPALDSHPKRSEQVTDLYLADLAARHGARFATFDQAIKHIAVEVIV